MTGKFLLWLNSILVVVNFFFVAWGVYTENYWYLFINGLGVACALWGVRSAERLIATQKAIKELKDERDRRLNDLGW